MMKMWSSWCKSSIFLLASEPVVLQVEEGGMANFTVFRAGPANYVTTVMFRVEYGEASPDDFKLMSSDTLLFFDTGEWEKNISVVIEEDDTPEDDERFYIILHNATGQLQPISLFVLF